MLYLQLPYLVRLRRFLQDILPVVITALGDLVVAMVGVGWGIYAEGKRRRLW